MAASDLPMWKDVSVNFNDANAAMASGLNSVSRAGDVFSKLNEQIAREEQNKIENDFKAQRLALDELNADRDIQFRRDQLQHTIDNDRELNELTRLRDKNTNEYQMRMLADREKQTAIEATRINADIADKNARLGLEKQRTDSLIAGQTLDQQQKKKELEDYQLHQDILRRSAGIAQESLVDAEKAKDESRKADARLAAFDKPINDIQKQIDDIDSYLVDAKKRYYSTTYDSDPALMGVRIGNSSYQIDTEDKQVLKSTIESVSKAREDLEAQKAALTLQIRQTPEYQEAAAAQARLGLEFSEKQNKANLYKSNIGIQTWIEQEDRRLGLDPNKYENTNAATLGNDAMKQTKELQQVKAKAAAERSLKDFYGEMEKALSANETVKKMSGEDDPKILRQLIDIIHKNGPHISAEAALGIALTHFNPELNKNLRWNMNVNDLAGNQVLEQQIAKEEMRIYGLLNQ